MSGGRLAVAGLLLSTLALGVFGIRRSLWLDEAWVANSLLAPTLSGMFYYPEWLQSTPPLFLLLARAAVHEFGVSNAAFRAVPLAFAVAAVAGMIGLTRRFLSPPFAALACAVLAFHPAAVEYSHTLKQYSAETAASVAILIAATLYLEDSTQRRFIWLILTMVVALPTAWSTVFLLPGVAIVVWANGGMARAGTLGGIVAAVLAILYFVFIRQNVAPELRAFWIAGAQRITPGLVAATFFCVAAAARVLIVIRRKSEPRQWIQIAALVPCFLLAAADLLHWYPANPRMRLFVLPCFLLVAAINAEDLYGWLLRKMPRVPRAATVATASLWAAAIGVGFGAVHREIRIQQNLQHGDQEDFEGAVRFLHQRVGAGDLLLVHASVIEGFRLYARVEGWRDPNARFGDTGWPCCARGKHAVPDSYSLPAVENDVHRMIPRGFSGRVWLFYSARNSHWVYVGHDEGGLWRNLFADRGCPAIADFHLRNLAISEMDCRSPR